MLRLSLAILRKDLRLCLARGSGLLRGLLLGLALILLFGLGRDNAMLPDARSAAMAFWLASLFVMNLSFGQLFQLEQNAGAAEQLAICPGPVQAIWLGKACAGFALIFCAQCVFLPATLIFLEQELSGPIWPGAAGLLLVDAGLSALGCLLGGLGNGREGLLAVLIFPLLCPLLLAGCGLLSATLGQRGADCAGWLAIAWAFDAIFFAAGLGLFGFIFPGGE